MNQHSGFWTDERTEDLKARWLNGESAGQISRALGGVSRSAVIGKVHRLGMSDAGRAKPSAPVPRFAARPASRAPKPPKPTAAVRAAVMGSKFTTPVEPAATDLPPETPGSATILTLGAHMCRWPIDVAGAFTFCGRRVDGGAYCVEHAQRAYLPRSKRNLDENAYVRSLRRFA